MRPDSHACQLFPALPRILCSPSCPGLSSMQPSLLLLLLCLPWPASCSSGQEGAGQEGQGGAGCRPTDGTAYTGRANTTEGGLPCQMWSVDTPHNSFHPEVGEHNFCRSPDGDRLWCYTTDPGQGWQYCDVPLCATQSAGDLDCRPTDGRAYSGKTNTTRSGRKCQMWSVKTPHDHSFGGVGEHNYCRSPDGDAPWCYTTDPRKEREYCEVHHCEIYTKGKTKQ